MKYIILIIFLLLSFNLVKSQPADFTEKVDKYIEKAYKDWKIPGMAIAIIKDDKIIFEKGYGVKEINKPGKVDKNTMFGIASNTKAFTASAIGILVDQGKLNWNDKVIKYLPYFKMYNDYVTNNFTISDLLSHHSGLKTFSGDLLWDATSYNRKEIIERIQYLKPKYGFRAHYGYSNLMFLVAGQIITEVSDTNYDDFLKYHFFKPLKMDNTNSSIKYQNKENLAIPHVEKNNKIIPIKYISWDNIAPAGAINSTVDDMAKWIKLQLNQGKLDGKQYFSKEVSIKIKSSQTIEEISSSDRYFFPSMHFHTYGMGFDLFDYHGKKIVNHSGGLDGMISQVVMVPEENLGFVILTNSINYLPTALMYKILDIYFEKENLDYGAMFLKYYKFRQNKVNKNNKQLYATINDSLKTKFDINKYTGTYEGKLYGNTTIKLKNNKLFLQFEPAKLFNSELTHWQADTFLVEFKEFPSLPVGKAYFVYKNNKINELKIDVPNPDFDFTELKFYYKPNKNSENKE